VFHRFYTYRLKPNRPFYTYTFCLHLISPTPLIYTYFPSVTRHSYFILPLEFHDFLATGSDFAPMK